MRRRAIMTVLVLVVAREVRADDDPKRPPMPEPIFTETVTDLDGDEAGELEVELNASTLRARRGGAYLYQGSVEVEWLATRRLGLRFEPLASRGRDPGALEAKTEVGASAGVSWKLMQDFAHDFHLQVEALGRAPWNHTSIIAQPGDPELPFVLDLRSGVRMGWLTVRSGVGVGAGGSSAHAPVRASLALLTNFEPSGRFGFWGIEMDADAARDDPFVLALNIVPDLTPTGLPFRVGLALPWNIVGISSGEPGLGIFVRLFYVSGREIEFGRGAVRPHSSASR